MRIIGALQQQMNATFSRSDVLRPLHIMLGTLVLLLLGLSATKAPEWLLSYAAYGFGATVALELIAYLFCLFIDRDALRSERYQLQKMAIQARLLGDEASGMFELEEVQGKQEQLRAPPKAISAHAVEIEPSPLRKPPRARSGRASGEQL
jgi:hypothetical protein